MGELPVGRGPALKPAFEEFRSREAAWLDDFALFMALKEAHGGVSWYEWPEELILRNPSLCNAPGKSWPTRWSVHRFRQFLFSRQWGALKQYAQQRGIRMIGDMPIFVAADSADVWANPELFQLDERRPAEVWSPACRRTISARPVSSGATRCTTGRPCSAAAMPGGSAGLRAALTQVDLVRLDHFRGFEAYWEVPAGQPTAEHGRWVKGPGADFFRRCATSWAGCRSSPRIWASSRRRSRRCASDSICRACASCSSPSAARASNRFLPHNYERNTRGLHRHARQRHDARLVSDADRGRATILPRATWPSDGGDVAWDLIRLAWTSVADYAIAPLQDVLSLGSEARMNRPGTPRATGAGASAPTGSPSHCSIGSPS